jgi:hypothetical protein
MRTGPASAPAAGSRRCRPAVGQGGGAGSPRATWEGHAGSCAILLLAWQALVLS